MLTAKQQKWRQIWPNRLIGVIGSIQLLLNLSIIGLELTSVLFDYVRSTSFAGFYGSLFFTITWLSMFSITCCNRHSLGCATHALIENILALSASIVIIVFDSIFISYPYTCIFGTIYCSQATFFSNSTSLYGINNPTFYVVKVSALKAQLACAALMLTTNIVYIIIFIVVVVKTMDLTHQGTIVRQNSVYPTEMQRQEIIYTSTSQSQSLPQSTMIPCVKCYNCQVLVPIPSTATMTINQNQFRGETSVDQHNTVLTSTITRSSRNEANQVSKAQQQQRPGTVSSSILGSAYANQVNRTYMHPVTYQPMPTIYQNEPNQLTQYENNWRTKFLRIPCIIIAVVQVIFANSVCAMEISSLAVAIGYLPTGVGIWGSIPVTITGILTFILTTQWKGSRPWSTRVLIAQLSSIPFTIAILGLTGDYVRTGGYAYIYGLYSGTYLSGNILIKYQLTIAELSFAGVLLCAELAYVLLYVYVTFTALWLPFHNLDLRHILRA